MGTSMNLPELILLRHFTEREKDLAGNLIKWEDYHGQTMQELDRLRHIIGSRCVVIRGSHGSGKETAVDCVFPEAEFEVVVLALLRSGFSKGFYQSGSIHLDMKMGHDGLARLWIAFKPEDAGNIRNLGLWHLFNYSADGWDYFSMSHVDSWPLLNHLVEVNA